MHRRATSFLGSAFAPPRCGANILCLQEDINAVGAIAWKVRLLICNDRPQTLAQRRRKLNGTGDLLSFALGWLAREDQIEVTPEKKHREPESDSNMKG